MNYFEIMDLPVSFRVDEELLRSRYYENSKRYHPDFYTMADNSEKERVMELSTLNNQAYQTLKDFDKRLPYVLELTGVLVKNEKYDLSSEFLMEIMEVNEGLMDLQMDFDEVKFITIKKAFEALEKEINVNITDCIHSISIPKAESEELHRLKELYYRKKYLLRIKENLNKFESL